MNQPAGSRVKKALKIALGIFGGLVALVSLAIGGTLMVLRTNWGGERLRRQLISRVNEQIRGTLGIERLSFAGDSLQVWGVTLRDPQGGVVARVVRAEVRFAILRLLRKELRVTGVLVDSPMISVVSEDGGSNLARATAPRQKTPLKAESKKPVDKNGPDGWVVRLDRLDLTNGDIRTAVPATEGDQEPQVTAHVARVGVFASARLATGNGSTDLTLRVWATSEHEPVGPLQLEVHLVAHGNVSRFDAHGDDFAIWSRALGLAEISLLSSQPPSG